MHTWLWGQVLTEDTCAGGGWWRTGHPGLPAPAVPMAPGQSSPAPQDQWSCRAVTHREERPAHGKLPPILRPQGAGGPGWSPCVGQTSVSPTHGPGAQLPQVVSPRTPQHCMLSPSRKAHFQKQNQEMKRRGLGFREDGAGMTCLFLASTIKTLDTAQTTHWRWLWKVDGGRLAGTSESKEPHGNVFPGLFFFLLQVFLKEPKKATNKKCQETQKKTLNKSCSDQRIRRGTTTPPSRTGHWWMATTLLQPDPTLVTQAVKPPTPVGWGWSGPSGELECSPPQGPHGKAGLSLPPGGAPPPWRVRTFTPPSSSENAPPPPVSLEATWGAVMRHPWPSWPLQAMWGAGTPFLAQQ